MSMPKLRMRFFTLIELLVVVAIIAVLISVLLPALQNAREMARKSACQSQQRQLYFGMSSYADDWNDWGFDCVYSHQPHFTYNRPNWLAYFGNVNATELGNLFVCPATSPKAWGYYTPGTQWATYNLMCARGSYDYVNQYYELGGWYMSGGNASPGPSGNPDTDRARNPCARRTYLGRWVRSDGPHPSQGWYRYYYFDEPADHPALTDCFGFNPQEGFWRSTWLGNPWADGGYIPNNHFALNGENVGMMDGHVSWIDTTKVWVNRYTWAGIPW